MTILKLKAVCHPVGDNQKTRPAWKDRRLTSGRVLFQSRGVNRTPPGLQVYLSILMRHAMSETKSRHMHPPLGPFLHGFMVWFLPLRRMLSPPHAPTGSVRWFQAFARGSMSKKQFNSAQGSTSACDESRIQYRVNEVFRQTMIKVLMTMKRGTSAASTQSPSKRSPMSELRLPDPDTPAHRRTQTDPAIFRRHIA